MTTAKDMRVVRLAAIPAAGLAAVSRTGLDRPLTNSAELVVAVPSDEALILGSMQRLSELDAAGIDPSKLVTRRGSGGAEVSIGPGTVWIQLALTSPSALVACEPDRLINRYVRPLLLALAKVGAVAHYFDRDWVSAAKSPVAAVSFGHDTGTGRALVEAFVAVTTPFAVRDRASFLGKPPRTLRELLAVDRLTDHPVDPGRVADAVIDAYTAAYGIGELSLDTASEMTLDLSQDYAGGAADAPRNDPPWSATRHEAIGLVAAGRDREGRLRVGGELMASRDVMARLESEIAAAAVGGQIDGARIDRAVDTLAAPGVAMLGVRTLQTIRDAIQEALQ